MNGPCYQLRPIGWVESPLADLAGAPAQGDEGAPDASLILDPQVRPAARELEVGAEVIVLTWLDRADRLAIDGTPVLDIKPLLGPVSER